MTLVIKFQPGLRPVIKHLAGQHDQKTHGSWSQGITDEFNTWSPKDKVPPSPPNKGSVPAKAWDNWEHGPDGYQYTELYRYYAGQMLGLKVPESPFLPGGWANYMTQRGFGGSSLETSKKHAEAMLKAIEKGTPQPTLWRGLTPSRNDEETQKLIEDFKNLKPGETIDMPLVSTTRSLGVATWYADARNTGAGDVPVVLKITGASGISRSPETSFYPADYEVITSGKFEVVDINKVSVTPWERESVSIGMTSDEKYAYTGGRSMDEYRDSKGEVAPSIYKQFYEGYTTGNYKGLESDSKQFTQFRGQDIPPNKNLEYGNLIYAHRWDKQPKKDFVVVELKLVEPHRVAKASTDYGLKFDGLFLGRVVDQTLEEADFNKHLAGQHDQKTHGLWANSGLPHELEDIKGSLKKYFEAGLLGNRNEIMGQKRRYQSNPETGETEYVTVWEKTRSSLGHDYSYKQPDQEVDPEGYQIYEEAERKLLGGNREGIELMARQEADDAGMGSRQALYYEQAIVSRAQLYLNLENAIIMGEAVRKIYSRDVSDYKEKGNKEFFKTQEETIKIMGENISKSVPVIAIETDNFLGVIKDGRFKTQYEMRESNGAYKPALRREAELALSGIPLDTKASERPIYGYLAFQENGKTANTSDYNTDRWNFNNSGVGQYGEVRVVLKDEVRERTSYTSIDSLDRYGIPQPLSKTSKNDLIRSGVYQDLTWSHGGYQRESYTEAQVYGGVKLADIKAVYVTRSYDYDEKTNTYTRFDTEAQAESIRSALQAKGLDIPVKILEPEKGEE